MNDQPRPQDTDLSLTDPATTTDDLAEDVLAVTHTGVQALVAIHKLICTEAWLSEQTAPQIARLYEGVHQTVKDYLFALGEPDPATVIESGREPEPFAPYLVERSQAAGRNPPPLPGGSSGYSVP